MAWLSLDPGDSDPPMFWAYVLAALRTAAPDVGGSAQVLLESPGGTPITTVLTSLLNDLAASDVEIVLVLDDYHVVHAPEIHEAMAFLVDHLPRQLRLVIATRSDPPLPLARLRARGELAEVRAADLRFTEQETAAYFGVMGLRLSAGEVTTLDGRTEGWVAALQLAALSLQGREDSAGFIEGFAGDDRHVVDYLVEEVVHRQPEEVRDFLLRTSVLHPAVRAPGRRRHRPDRRPRDARDAGPRQPLPGAARRPAAVVPLPPPLRRHAPGPAPRRADRARRPSCTAGPAPGTSRTATPPRPSSTLWPRATSTAPPPSSSAASGRWAKDRREAQLRRWMEALPDEVFARPSRARQRLRRRR